MDTLEAIFTRRSVRDFIDKTISEVETARPAQGWDAGTVR